MHLNLGESAPRVSRNGLLFTSRVVPNFSVSMGVWHTPPRRGLATNASNFPITFPDTKKSDPIPISTPIRRVYDAGGITRIGRVGGIMARSAFCIVVTLT